MEFKGKKLNKTQFLFSRLKVHPTYEKDREDGILVEFSFSLQRHADLPHDLALASNSHYYHKPIPCNSKVSFNCTQHIKHTIIRPKNLTQMEFSAE